MHNPVADAADAPPRAGSGPPDHPLRYALANEVHARPVRGAERTGPRRAGGAAGGVPLEVDLALGLAVLPVADLVWFGVRRVRRRVTKARGAEDG